MVQNDVWSLVKETESHVVVLLLGLFLLLLLLGLGGGGVASGGGGTSGSGGGTNSGSNVGDELLDVGGLKSLGEEAGPEGLDGDAGGLQDGLDLLTLKLKVEINTIEFQLKF